MLLLPSEASIIHYGFVILIGWMLRYLDFWS